MIATTARPCLRIALALLLLVPAFALFRADHLRGGEDAAVKAAPCDIFREPDKYAGRLVQVRAFLVGEWQRFLLIHDPSRSPCTPGMSVVLAFSRELRKSASVRQLERAIGSPVGLEATVVGRFDTSFSSGSPVRIGHYQFQGRIQVVEVLDVTEQWWETKPYMEWSVMEANQIIDRSPWVADVPVTTGKVPGQAGPRYAKLRLLTARPVREAYLKLIAAGRNREATSVRVDELAAPDGARLNAFMAANPNDIRVTGDDHRIVVALTSSVVIESSVEDASGRRIVYLRGQEEIRPGGLMQQAGVEKTTFLATDSGKRVPLVLYEPPGSDQLGARFYFDRNLPDGTPLVAAGDKELIFETRITGKRIRATFDLTKLVYKGKLEL